MRLLGLVTKRKRLPIGIDIGSESIKMLQLQVSAGQTPSVSAAALWRFPRGASKDPAQRRQQAVEAVNGMLRQGGFSRRDAVSALSCSQMGIKNVRLPHMPPNELARGHQVGGHRAFRLRGLRRPVELDRRR